MLNRAMICSRLPFAHHVPRAAGVLICKRVLVTAQIRAPESYAGCTFAKVLFRLEGPKRIAGLAADLKTSLGQILSCSTADAHHLHIRCEPQISRRFMDPTPPPGAERRRSVCRAAQVPLSTTHSAATPHASASETPVASVDDFRG